MTSGSFTMAKIKVVIEPVICEICGACVSLQFEVVIWVLVLSEILISLRNIFKRSPISHKHPGGNAYVSGYHSQ